MPNLTTADVHDILTIGGTLLSVTVGAVLNGDYQWWQRQQKEQNAARVARARITAPLSACMTTLQFAYLTNQVDVTLLAKWMGP